MEKSRGKVVPAVSMSTTVLNQAVEAVISLINGLSLYATMTRGALGTGNNLSCEIGPTTPEIVFLDKNKYIPVDLTINGKHTNLETLSDALNKIHEDLTMRRSYPYGNGWEIVDITTANEPQVIGREDSNQWIMASALTVKVATSLPVTPDPDPVPDPVPDPDDEQPDEQE